MVAAEEYTVFVVDAAKMKARIILAIAPSVIFAGVVGEPMRVNALIMQKHDKIP